MIVIVGALKELKPLSALPWGRLPAVEEEDGSAAARKPARKREWRGVSGVSAAKRLRSAKEFRAREYEDLEDWEEGGRLLCDARKLKKASSKSEISCGLGGRHS